MLVPVLLSRLEMVVSFGGRPQESGRMRAGGDGGGSDTEGSDPATDPARGSA